MLAIIAEHDPKIRYAISMLAQEHPGLMITHMVSTFSDLTGVLGSTYPELLVFDLDMPGAKENSLDGIYPSSLKHIIYLVSDPGVVHQQVKNCSIKQTWVNKTEYPENLVKVFKTME